MQHIARDSTTSGIYALSASVTVEEHITTLLSACEQRPLLQFKLKRSLQKEFIRAKLGGDKVHGK